MEELEWKPERIAELHPNIPVPPHLWPSYVTAAVSHRELLTVNIAAAAAAAELQRAELQREERPHQIAVVEQRLCSSTHQASNRGLFFHRVSVLWGWGVTRGGGGKS